MLVFIAVIKKWTEKFMARICNGFSYEIKERDLHKKMPSLQKSSEYDNDSSDEFHKRLQSTHVLRFRYFKFKFLKIQ